MTVTNVGANEVISARSFKRLVPSPADVWGNTYELAASTGPVDVNWISVGQAFQTFERAFHLTDVAFDRVVFSTEAEDQAPYNPLNVAVYAPLTSPLGQRAITQAGSQLPLQVCIAVRKNTTYGRIGRSLYRRCVTETDVTGAGSSFALDGADATALSNAINTAFNNLKTALNAQGLVLIMKRGAAGVYNPSTVRTVDAMSLDKVTVKQFRNQRRKLPA